MEIEEVIKNEIIPLEELLIPVLIGTIEPKNASNIIQILTNKYPLELYELRHLKRIRKYLNNLEIIICPEINQNNLNNEIKELFIEIKVILVSKYKPQNRNEFKLWGEYWPIIFRPTEVSEERERGLPKHEIQQIQSFLLLLNQNMNGLIVDPNTNEIITNVDLAKQYLITQHLFNIEQHPLYSTSPTLLCVEGVAAITRGDITSNLTRNLKDEQQYVCTGLDIYLYEEPDIMSSMALIHSRIRRVIYIHSNNTEGALGSIYSLHQMRCLNHRFRVFHVKNS